MRCMELARDQTASSLSRLLSALSVYPYRRKEVDSDP